ncbi:hypothetical protein BAUCODRAFT_26928 [Baudoinia panamericana UAMH 10762]|uniref:Apple domain-containing protein n=1 Tax=Baudoinia panamericana (strain UAMH 10762) TaxID=717646 RepID=M2MB45_BAUPA|nr:uncharacterized protein BAUCODRAFT_26928 [Baudoinia panamericana UAMH 10762]EMC93701.1 hypothetical protein BAUCODRAFT_26928 [Baudoinia panamericana UAMH 10762]
MLVALVATLGLSGVAMAKPISQRAGSPGFVPIPTNCTIDDSLPGSSSGSTNISGYMPSADFTSDNLVYSSYFDSYLNQSAQIQQCREQCYGYGQCKSALLAYQVPTPAGYYGTAGGVLESACLLYDAYLDENAFVAAPAGQYINETAGNIYCPP